MILFNKPGRQKIVTEDLRYSVDEIISSTTEEFRIMRDNLTVEQFERVKRIRLRGRNLISATNSRKRKSDEMDELEVRLDNSKKFGNEMIMKLAEHTAIRDEKSEELNREVHRFLVRRDLDPQTHTVQFGDDGVAEIVEVWNGIQEA